MKEQFQQFGVKTEKSDIEFRENQLKQNLPVTMICYADHLFNDSDKSKNFSSILYQIIPGIFDNLQNKEITLNKFLNDIDSIYLNAKEKNIDFAQPILNYIKESKKEDINGEIVPSNELNEDNNHIGLLNYDLVDEKELGPLLQEKLKQENFSDSDVFLMINLKPAFNNQADNIKDIKKDLNILAERINNEYPKISAIIGVSWLLDHPVVQKLLGFKILYDDGSINLGQFIDRDGNIKQEKIDYLFKEKRPPQRNLFGYIRRDDFLNKFLQKL